MQLADIEKKNCQTVLKGEKCTRKLQRSIISTVHSQYIENPDLSKY